MKIELQVTSIKQSRQLLAAGIAIDTASMAYTHLDNDEKQYSVTPIVDGYTYDVPGGIIWPAWTMGDLIDLLPSTLCNVNTGEYANLSICKGGVFYDKFDKYGPLVNIRKYDCGSLIECLVDAICELCGKKNK